MAVLTLWFLGQRLLAEVFGLGCRGASPGRLGVTAAGKKGMFQ
jgi:hypothetical protein